MTAAGAQRTVRPPALPSLTGLRFVAATAVFGYHYLYLLDGRAQQLFLPVFGRGGAGVGLFFVLSGFVLAWTRQPGDTPRRFYQRRVARILPVYALAWLTAGVVLLVLHGRLDVPVAVLNALLMQSWVPDWHVYFGWNGVAWSLSCEAFFYAVFPFAIAWLEQLTSAGRRATAVALVSVTVGAAAAVSFVSAQTGLLYPQLDRWGWLVYICPIGRLPEFLLGCLLALELKAGRLPRIPVWAAVAVTVVAYRWAYDAHHLTTQTAVLLAPFMLLVVALAQTDVARGPLRIAAARPIVSLGEWSYSFYLFHGLALGLFTEHHAAISAITTGGLTMLGLAASVWIVSAVMFRFVERPMSTRLRRQTLSTSMLAPVPQTRFPPLRHGGQNRHFARRASQ